MESVKHLAKKDISFPFKLNDRFFKSFSELSRVSFVLGLGLRPRLLQPLSPDQTGRENWYFRQQDTETISAFRFRRY